MHENTGATEAPSLARFFAFEETALRAGRPASRVAVVAEQGVLSIGIGVREEASYVRGARRRGVPVVRRASGGTGLLHLRDDLLWSVVLPRADPRVGRDFVRGYARLGEAVVGTLRSLGLASSWADAPAVCEEYCPLGSRGKVLVADGRVLGGAAQHVTSRALLHHGAISTAVDRPLLDLLFGWTDPGPASRLVGLSELGVDRPAELLARELDAGLARFVRRPDPTADPD